MIKTIIIAGLASLSMGAAPAVPAPPAGSGPAFAVCIAGLNIGLGGEAPVRVSLSQRLGRCGCPDGCSTVQLDIAGFTFRL